MRNKSAQNKSVGTCSPEEKRINVKWEFTYLHILIRYMNSLPLSSSIYDLNYLLTFLTFQVADDNTVYATESGKKEDIKSS